MIDPTFGWEPFNGGRLEVSDAEVDPEFPGQSDPDRRPPSSFLFRPPSFHYLASLLSTKVAMPTMVAPNLPTAPSLPCLKTDLCPDRSLEAETAGLKMVKKWASNWQIGSFWVNVQMFSFCIGLFGIRTALTKPPQIGFYHQPPFCV